MNDNDRNVVNAMTQYGGGFVKALAEAARKADPTNLEAIKNAWPDYWVKYSGMVDTPPPSPRVFNVPVAFTFSGVFHIRANDEEGAVEAANEHVGLVLGGNIHSTLPDEDVNWEFPAHPDRAVGTPY
jgi:hypothetical protein